jgi:toxin ParE1/3/4
MRAHFTPQAEIDLEEIGNYIALDNPGRAVSFIREMRQHCEKIAEGPHHYVARPDLGDTIRIGSHGNYRLRAVRRRRTHTASSSGCPKRARSSRQLNDPLIAIRVAWLPKHLDPFGIYRP